MISLGKQAERAALPRDCELRPTPVVLLPHVDVASSVAITKRRHKAHAPAHQSALPRTSQRDEHISHPRARMREAVLHKRRQGPG
jgi:hypothetical protein